MKNFSQYFTSRVFADLMVRLSNQTGVSTIMDLGFGDGSLSRAALNVYPDAEYQLVDIDVNMCCALKALNNKTHIRNADILSESFYHDCGDYVHTVDLSICNPPYEQVVCSSCHVQLFHKVGLNRMAKMKRVSAAAIFLAYNLLFLKASGKIAIILPDGMLTRKDYGLFRNDILDCCSIECVIQLPDNSFVQTEARTHIVVLSLENNASDTVPIGIADSNGHIIETLFVKKEALGDRMDYSFHKWFSTINRHGSADLALKNIIDIKRGHQTYKDLRNLNKQPYFHSINFGEKSNLCFGDNQYLHLNNPVIAEPGDILMCRVGKRCVGKIAIVSRGRIVVSDCIYRIRVLEKYRRAILEYFLTDSGRLWIRTMSHGVCSKVISKSDLYDQISRLIIDIQKQEIC